MVRYSIHTSLFHYGKKNIENQIVIIYNIVESERRETDENKRYGSGEEKGRQVY